MNVLKNKILNFNDKNDASYGYLGTIDSGCIIDDNQKVVFDMKKYYFIKGDCPSTVNPSLWHQAQMLKYNGLFKVLENAIYQIRGFDISNMTFVKTNKDRWIIIDCLTTMETAQAAITLFENIMGKIIVDSIIITHSHIDHFGGLLGLITHLGYTPNIIAPEGYVEEAVSENIVTGASMARRATYMYGNSLEASINGQISAGLGLAIPQGISSLVAPTITISKDMPKLIIDDDFEIEFLDANGTEAPSEFIFYLPQYKAMCVAELVNHTMHNLYTLRGSKIRNGLLWSETIDKMIVKFGSKTEISFGGHYWPTFSNDKILNLWTKQRDLYRYIHDQCVRLGNSGYNACQIASIVKLPPELKSELFNRGYYGTLSHNLKAQYQLYFGWFDGNPANLNPLPDPLESSLYVKIMGGSSRVISQAKKAIRKKNYRWAVTILNKVVQSETSNNEARALLSKVYTVMAQQQENATWRNFYLTAAKELLYGAITKQNITLGISLLDNMTCNQIGNFMASCLIATKVYGLNYKIIIYFFDYDQSLYLELSNCTLVSRVNYTGNKIDSVVKIAKVDLFKLLLKKTSIDDLIIQQCIEISDDLKYFETLISAIEVSEATWNVITPNPSIRYKFN